MKATGITRRIDDLGRIVIPKEIRHNLGIKEGDALELFIEEDAVCFRKIEFDCKLSLDRLIRNIIDGNDENFDKNEILDLLYEVKERMSKPR